MLPGLRRRGGSGGLCLAIHGLLLVLATCWVYARVGSFGFVWDDAAYILGNPIVAGGLSAKALARSFAFSSSNWHPLAWFSHMLDVELFGMDPGLHHWVNVGVHAACAVTLLGLIGALTRSLWAATFAAAFFALHPLRVESVAWVTERKDALSTLFFLLAALLWIRGPTPPPRTARLVAGILFALALMTKAMAVTLPLVLLLLDWWPLGRLAGVATGGHARAMAMLAREKAPLFLLGIGTGVAALLAQARFGALQSLTDFPLSARLAQAPVSAVAYLGKTLWPARLAVFYPHTGAAPPLWQVAGSGLLLVVLTVLLFLVRKRYPWAIVGWGWYLITLLPVVGLVQVSKQAMADRYTYLPSAGLALILGGAAARIGRSYPRRVHALPPAAALLCTVLAVQARAQSLFWRDNAALYGHALSVTRGNWLMLNNRGIELERRGDLAGAEHDFREALRLRPNLADARANLARVQEKQGDAAAATETLREGLALEPGSAAANVELAGVLARRGLRREAAGLLEESLRLGNGSVPARVLLATLYGEEGRAAEAEALLRAALEDAADSPVVPMNLAISLAQQGRFGEAFEMFREAIRRAPLDAEPHFNYGLALELACRRGEAILELREALRLQPGHTRARAALAATVAEPAVVPPAKMPGSGR